MNLKEEEDEKMKYIIAFTFFKSIQGHSDLYQSDAFRQVKHVISMQMYFVNTYVEHKG